MQEVTKTFTYTAQRSAYLTLVGTFGFMFLAEGGLIGLLISILAHNVLLKFALLVAHTSLMLFAFSLLLVPLWTKHRLTATRLQLRYGFALNIAIPRTSIISARPVHEKMTALVSAKARYDAKKQCIVASFSEQGQVLLSLAQALPLKAGHTTYITKTILINIDKRDAFLAALDGSHMPLVKEEAVPKFSVSDALHPVLPPVDRSSYGMVPAIHIEGLKRTFAALSAVDNLNMKIMRGEIYGFLGSNGAGKTTTIKMLVGLLQPSAGHVWIAGHDMWTEPLPAKEALGYVSDHALLYERLTGREFLLFLCQVRKLSPKEAQQRIVYLLDLLELTEHADRSCGAYSFGMKRKLALAGALIHQPQVLVLDEPLNGLDPRSSRCIKDLFIDLASKGTAILLSTHDLASAEAICHRIGIIHKGRLLAEGSASELRQLVAAPDLEAVFLNLTATTQEEVSV